MFACTRLYVHVGTFCESKQQMFVRPCAGRSLPQTSHIHCDVQHNDIKLTECDPISAVYKLLILFMESLKHVEWVRVTDVIVWSIPPIDGLLGWLITCLLTSWLLDVLHYLSFMASLCLMRKGWNMKRIWKWPQISARKQQHSDCKFCNKQNEWFSPQQCCHKVQHEYR